MLLATSLAAQTRQRLSLNDGVALVVSHNRAGCSTFFRDYARLLTKQGINIPADYVEQLGLDHYGTGLVVRAADGRCYVVTSKHVVEFSDFVTVEFPRVGRSIVLDSLPIAMMAEEPDLALIELPADRTYSALTLDTGTIEAGLAVTAYGFGLRADSPVPVAGSGLVIEPAYYDTLLLNDFGPDIIVHSAYKQELFPGYLLYADRPGINTKQVVGIGGIALTGPDSTGYAIPAARIQEMLARLTPAQTGSAAVLPTLLERLESSAEEGFIRLLPNLSRCYMFNKKPKETAAAIDSLPSGLRAKYVELNETGQVENALRLLSAYTAAADLRAANFKATGSEENGTTVKLISDDRREVVFDRSTGRAWQINRVGRRTKAEKQPRTSYRTSSSASIVDNLFGTTVAFKFMTPYSAKYTDFAFNFALGYIFKYITLEAVLELTPVMPTEAALYNYECSNFLGVGLRIGGIVPIRVAPKLLLVPNIKLQLGYQTSLEYTAQYYNVSGMAGLDLFVRLSPRGEYFFVGAQYEHKGMFSTVYRDIPLNNMGYINAKVGFLF